jgi:hypothetical protein
MFPYTFVTTTSTPALVQLNGGHATDFIGIIATSMEAAGAMFVKLWWGGASNATPVLGTTLPTLTISIPQTGIMQSLDISMVYPGPVWVAVTKNNVGTDATALVTGGGVVTLLLE